MIALHCKCDHTKSTTSPCSVTRVGMCSAVAPPVTSTAAPGNTAAAAHGVGAAAEHTVYTAAAQAAGNTVVVATADVLDDTLGADTLVDTDIWR